MASVRTAVDTGAEIRPVENIGASVGDGAVAAVGFRDVNGDNYPVAAVMMGLTGGVRDLMRVANVFKDFASTAITAGTPVAIWTPAAGKKFRLLGWALSLSVAGSIIFKYGAGNTTMFRTPALAAAGVHTSPALGNGSMPGAANDVLKVDVTATGSVAGFVFGVEE